MPPVKSITQKNDLLELNVINCEKYELLLYYLYVTFIHLKNENDLK